MRPSATLLYRQGSLETALLSMYVSGAFRKLIHETRFDRLRIAGNDRHRLRSLPVLLKDMHVGRTIVAFLVALSLAMLPMSRVFAMAAMANGETTATNEMVAMQHHHCDHDAMPADHGMKDRPASADCAAKQAGRATPWRRPVGCHSARI